nr:glycosyltransferase family 4 protein [Lachnospiraceae bacterium]
SYPKNVCVKRFYSHYIWGNNVIKYIKNRKKPDVIYAAIPSLTAANKVAKYCKANDIRFVIDVQDLWPEAFQMVVNIPIVSELAFAPFKFLADGIYKRADEIVAVSKSYANRARRVNKNARAHAIYLGTELDKFDEYLTSETVIKKNANEVLIAYCGTLGSSYDITIVIEALKRLDSEGIKNYRFIVMGDGPRFDEFKLMAKKAGINAFFTGRIPYDQMCATLKNCDITVNPIAHNAAQSIINKHADYVAAGLPIVSTQESLEFRKLIDKYEMGFNVDNSDVLGLASKLKLLIKDKDLRIKMGNNARKCAKKRFDRKLTYEVIVRAIEGRDD